MCAICGCGGDGATIEGVGGKAEGSHSHSHSHDHDHDHDHSHGHDHTHEGGDASMRGEVRAQQTSANREAGRRRLAVELELLARNDAQAAENRRRFDERRILALNLVSSPGSGKTTLLERTIARLAGRLPVAVIEGDQQTSRDADRIRAAGAPAIQVNTGRGCHLDARMVADALQRLPVEPDGVLLIENVGNLVCPAAFDLGEAHKVVILSVTEGEDKPVKYPEMFRAADVMLLNKCDLLPHLDYDIALAEACARRVNPRLRIIRVSARTGEGLDDWIDWLLDRQAALGRGPDSAGVDRD